MPPQHHHQQHATRPDSHMPPPQHLQQQQQPLSPAPPDLETVLRRGTGVARRVLSDPGIEGDPLAFLKATEAYWKALRQQKHEPHKKGPTVVTTDPAPLLSPPSAAAGAAAAGAGAAAAPAGAPFDAVVCGGTLGLLPALALARRGWRVAVVERRRAEGRTQEWNSSRGEVAALVEAGMVTQEELERCITSEYNPVRVGFRGGEDIWVNDCLNIGVMPQTLLRFVRERFESLGGVVYEHTEFRSAAVHPDGVELTVAPARGAPPGLGDANRPTAVDGLRGSSAPAAAAAAASAAPLAAPAAPAGPAADSGGRGGEEGGPVPQAAGAAAAGGGGERGPWRLRARVVLDCMGHYSPVVKQLRGRAKPEGMCLVVGGCAEGFPAERNTTGDLLYSFTDSAADLQLFWEAFPAECGASPGSSSLRTTYMFAYTDAEPERPEFEKLLDAYFHLLPQYQGVALEQLKWRRVLFGGFPCYSNGPLAPGFDRILQIGDAGAAQSPLSFGGFGSMVRHLPRIERGLDDALASDRLARADLALLQPYQPSLSCAWLFQRAMSLGVGQLRSGSEPQQQKDETEAAAEGRRPPAAGGPAWAAAIGRAFAAAAAAAAAALRAALWRVGPGHINALLATNFSVLRFLGPRALKPFLQDTMRLAPLTLTMWGMMAARPPVVARVLCQVPPGVLLGWFAHYVALAAYTAADLALRPLRWAAGGAAKRWRGGYPLRRWLDAFEYGSSSDYQYHPSRPATAPAAAQPPAAAAAATPTAAAASPVVPAPPPTAFPTVFPTAGAAPA